MLRCDICVDHICAISGSAHSKLRVCACMCKCAWECVFARVCIVCVSVDQRALIYEHCDEVKHSRTHTRMHTHV